MVISKTNRGIDSEVLLRDILYGEVVEFHVKLYSPLIQQVRLAAFRGVAAAPTTRDALAGGRPR